MNHPSSEICREPIIAIRFQLGGTVQGIGVRPAIARFAALHDLSGFVSNQLDGVEIHVEGPRSRIKAFETRLKANLPALSDIQRFTPTPSLPLDLKGFEIRTAEPLGVIGTMVPRDLAACPECLKEAANRHDHRFDYAFATCTHCGPRYSIIKCMPYERFRTTMKDFLLCESCGQEYRSAVDRRFHAQTNACPDCGPQVWCETRLPPQTLHGRDAITRAANALIEGKIVAVKGVGGYQLLCDATNERAVALLRSRKHRRMKPLPVMIDRPTEADQFPEVLFSPSNPIVLLNSDLVAGLAESVHPDLKTVGVMLPTTPLHALLLKKCGRPIVVTSGNIEGDPLAYQNEPAQDRSKGSRI